MMIKKKFDIKLSTYDVHIKKKKIQVMDRVLCSRKPCTKAIEKKGQDQTEQALRSI